MGCPCQDKKKIPAATGSTAQTTYKVRLINWSDTPSMVVGKSTGTQYGDYKNGDRIRIRIEDYNAEPEMFVQL